MKRITIMITILMLLSILVIQIGCGSKPAVEEVPRVINTYRQVIPASRFIGIQYGPADGGYSEKWCEWFSEGRFDVLRELSPEEEFFQYSSATIGLMRCKENEPFQYWIGMFLPADTPVPAGYSFIDFDRFEIAVAEVFGPAPNIYWFWNESREAIIEEFEDINIGRNKRGELWSMERYSCPKFTTEDEAGNRILEHAFFVNHCGRCGAACVLNQ